LSGLGIQTVEMIFVVLEGGRTRYAPNGALDPRFGLGGISETNYGYVFSEPNTVRLQSEGQIVVCAGSTNGVAASAVTARYLGDSRQSSAEVPSKAAHQTRQDP
jgi:hypothetical protein